MDETTTKTFNAAKDAITQNATLNAKKRMDYGKPGICEMMYWETTEREYFVNVLHTLGGPLVQYSWRKKKGKNDEQQ